jgi:glycyl-tRNA synthetase
VADRGCYDVSAHLTHSGADLTAFERFDEPKEIELDKVKPINSRLGPLFKGKAGKIAEALSAVSPDQLPKGCSEIQVTVDGENVNVPADCWQVVRVREKVSGVKVVPHVIEPSYGLDRILYAVLDHAFHREGEYTRLRLKGLVAPIKLGVFPLVSKDGLDRIAEEISDELSILGVSTQFDDAGSIGRRYARMDEIGTPYCLTVDYDTLKDGTVTLRDRDSSEQVRVNRKDLASLATRIAQNLSFEEVKRGI